MSFILIVLIALGQVFVFITSFESSHFILQVYFTLYSILFNQTYFVNIDKHYHVILIKFILLICTCFVP